MSLKYRLAAALKLLWLAGATGLELLASGGCDHTVRVWDPATGHLERILQDRTAHWQRAARQ